MSNAKVSLSLSVSDIAFLDTEQLSGRYASRSAAVQDAVRLLRESRLADAYAQAFGEGYDEEWDSVADDGLASA
ncbi:antitoxin [Microbacterium sp. A8/3-1]|uniref:Antitoxin n=1 Tax=Microbacterium sp. A8/3-1 TaxID=3160749 RepID=A0AAU7VRE7_9MICO